MKPKLLILDTRDDRKEILQSLQRLSPADRLRWLSWCCSKAHLNGSQNRPMVTPLSRGDAMEVFLDFFGIVADYEIEVEAAARDLERRARKRGRRLGAR